MKAFDAIFHNGTILTMNDGRRAEAVAVVHGKVAVVGSKDDLLSARSSSTQLIDLEGCTLLPGFEDAHAHIWKLGQLLTSSVDLRGVASISTIGQQLAARDKALSTETWLQGRGFNEQSMEDRRLPRREDIDHYVSDRPVLLTRTCGHIFIANSTALKLAGIDSSTQAPAGGIIERDQHGNPTGILHETAIGLINRVLPPPTSLDYRAMIQAALCHQLANGITTSSECGVVPDLLETYLQMDAECALPARMNVMPLGKPDGAAPAPSSFKRYSSPMLSVHTVKFLADGGLSGGTAALSTPYRNSSARGVTRFDTHELFQLFAEFQNLGWRICTHAIGDAAIEQVLSLYEQLPRNAPQGPHRIEHVGLPSHAHLTRLARIGVQVVTQPIFLDELGGNFGCVPDVLTNRIYPIREMLDAGLTVAFSSDAPVVRDDAPLKGIEAAVTRRTAEGYEILPAQAVTVEEALYAYTAGSAIASGASDTRGSIQPGRCADFAVLSEDPTNVPSDGIAQIRVEQTYLGGKLVFDRSAI